MGGADRPGEEKPAEPKGAGAATPEPKGSGEGAEPREKAGDEPSEDQNEDG